MTQIIDIPVLLTVIGVLTVITNIIVEVLKKMTYNFIPTQFLAVAVAMGLTWAVFMWYVLTYNIMTIWIYYVAVIVVGFMVAYAAMFGFDTLKNALNKAIGGEDNGKN